MTIQAATLTLELAERIPTSATSEAALFDAYRVPAPVVRSVPCACGGMLSAARGDEPHAVAAHNESTVHQQWRARLKEA